MTVCLGHEEKSRMFRPVSQHAELSVTRGFTISNDGILEGIMFRIPYDRFRVAYSIQEGLQKLGI